MPTKVPDAVTVHVTFTLLRVPLSGPNGDTPLITTLDVPACWLPQSIVPEIEVKAPILPTAVPAAVISVSGVFSCAPDAASKAVTPVPSKLRSRSDAADPVPARTSTCPARRKMTIIGPEVPDWPRKKIWGPSIEGCPHRISWLVTGPVSPPVPVRLKWAVAGPLAGAAGGERVVEGV